jgi:hypothetical protein
MLYGIPAPRPRRSSEVNAKSEKKKMMTNKLLKKGTAKSRRAS